jgi:hypothetical protein
MERMFIESESARTDVIERNPDDPIKDRAIRIPAQPI